MASPSELIDGYSYVAAGGTVPEDSLVITRSALPTITAAIAHATTGDGRKVVAAIIKNIAAKFAALVTKPTKLLISYQSSTTTGKHEDIYRFNVTRTITVGDVAAEE